MGCMNIAKGVLDEGVRNLNISFFTFIFLKISQSMPCQE